MRAHWLVCILAIVCLGALSAALADETKPAPAAAGQPAGAEESGMQPATPGPEHAFLAKFSGRWKAAQRMMMDPTQPPMVSEGIEENTMICGGLFLKSEYTSKDEHGEFHGMGILGYDTRKQKYTGVWVDNYGTYLSPYEGTCENGKCTYTMPMIGPDGKPTECTMLYEIINDTSRTFTMSSPGKDGKMMTMMEITYTRM